MESHIVRFLDKATVPQLKEKLEQLGLDATGLKPLLKLRLEDAVKTLTPARVLEYFPKNFIIDDDDVDDDGDDEFNLDLQIETLRSQVKKQQEIIELQRKLAELTGEGTAPNNNYASFNFRDIEESINKYSGDDNYCITKWIQHFEESAEMYSLDERAKFICAKRLLSGTAKLFLKTQTVKSWNEFKYSLLREFSKRVSNADIHRELRNRKKKKEESFQTYLLSMQEISSLGMIEEVDLIQYIIDGIADSYVNKILLYNSNTLEDLKNALVKYERIKLNQSAYEVQKSRSIETFSRPAIKCFNCNLTGHTANTCTKPIRPKGSCFRCGKLGHRVNECSSQKPVMLVQDEEVIPDNSQIEKSFRS